MTTKSSQHKKSLTSSKDWTEEYALVGKYIAEFEFVVHSIRFSCSSLLQARGLKDWSLGEIILSQKVFTADPLITVFEHICGELLKNEIKFKNILDTISSFRAEFGKMITYRNDLVHSTHLYGPNVISASSNPEMFIFKRSPNKSGNRVVEIAAGSQELKDNILEIQVLKRRFNHISAQLIAALIERKLYPNAQPENDSKSPDKVTDI